MNRGRSAASLPGQVPTKKNALTAFKIEAAGAAFASWVVRLAGPKR